MAKRRITKTNKSIKPPIELSDDITKSFFYDIEALKPLPVTTKDNMLIVQNKGSEIAFEVNHDRNKIKLYHWDHTKKNSDMAVEVTMQQLVKFIRQINEDSKKKK